MRKGSQAALFLILVPMALAAQTAAPTSVSGSAPEPASSVTEAPKPYGEGEKAGLGYAGTSFVRNVLIIDLDQQSLYDDNVLGRGDASFRFGPNFLFRREGKRQTLAIEYRPDFLMYSKTAGYNSLQQGLTFDEDYHVNSHLSFRGRGSTFYRTGIFQPQTDNQIFQPIIGNQLMPRLGSPSSLNETVFTPLAREFGYNVRSDMIYQFSVRTSLSFFLGASGINFGHQTISQTGLHNTKGRSAGLLYSYRLSRHETLGLTYVLSDYRFGPVARTLVHNPVLSYSRQLSSHVSVDLFGGPAYTRTHNDPSLLSSLSPSEIPSFRAQWNWTLGGDMTTHWEKMAFQIAAQRQVSDGGGLLGAVLCSSLNAAVRRRLYRGVQAVWSGGYAHNSALASGPTASKVQNETAGFAIEDALSDNLSLGLGYNFVRQHGSGAQALFGNLTRNGVSISISYRLTRIPLGR
jgi:hypothetical protein